MRDGFYDGGRRTGCGSLSLVLRSVRLGSREVLTFDRASDAKLGAMVKMALTVPLMFSAFADQVRFLSTMIIGMTRFESGDTAYEDVK
jgi:hypothetical protein